MDCFCECGGIGGKRGEQENEGGRGRRERGGAREVEWEKKGQERSVRSSDKMRKEGREDRGRRGKMGKDGN
jgi:hypothetical protein